MPGGVRRRIGCSGGGCPAGIVELQDASGSFPFGSGKCHTEVAPVADSMTSLGTSLTIRCDKGGPYRLPACPHEDLSNDVLSAVYFGQDFITSLFGSLPLDYEVTGPMKLILSQPSPPEVTVQCNGAKMPLTLYGSISDQSGKSLIDFEVNATVGLKLGVRNGFFGADAQPVIDAGLLIYSVDGDCGCEEDPRDIIYPLVMDHVNQLFSGLNCKAQLGLLLPSLFGEYYGDGECGYNEGFAMCSSLALEDL